MTREEASFYLANIDRKYMEKGMSEALDMAIKSLEQQPCNVPDINVGDMISRQAVLDALEWKWAGKAAFDAIKELPSVTAHITPKVLADALMEERIRGTLNSDTTFEKDIIRDVKCRLTVSIRDHRPCYCGAELRIKYGRYRFSN